MKDSAPPGTTFKPLTSRSVSKTKSLKDTPKKHIRGRTGNGSQVKKPRHRTDDYNHKNKKKKGKEMKLRSLLVGSMEGKLRGSDDSKSDFFNGKCWKFFIHGKYFWY